MQKSTSLLRKDSLTIEIEENLISDLFAEWKIDVVTFSCRRCSIIRFSSSTAFGLILYELKNALHAARRAHSALSALFLNSFANATAK